MGKIVLATGGFDPIHSGHIEYLKHAATLGDKLIVGVNSEEWLTRKKGKPFMTVDERVSIIRHLNMVDRVILFDDTDDTANDAIRIVKEVYGLPIIFANGGDRNQDNIPEMIHDDVEFAFGVGGVDKKNSSSWILNNAISETAIKKNWGEYKILAQGNSYQVKQLTFDPGQSISTQRHFHRWEHWHVIDGKIQIQLDDIVKIYSSGDSIDIPTGSLHKATNIGSTKAKIIEVWHGKILSEKDIERIV